MQLEGEDIQVPPIATLASVLRVNNFTSFHHRKRRNPPSPEIEEYLSVCLPFGSNFRIYRMFGHYVLVMRENCTLLENNVPPEHHVGKRIHSTDKFKCKFFNVITVKNAMLDFQDQLRTLVTHLQRCTIAVLGALRHPSNSQYLNRDIRQEIAKLFYALYRAEILRDLNR